MIAAMSAWAVSPDEIEYKDADGRIMTVIDPAGLLSPDVRRQVGDRLEQLRLRSTTEVEVVIVPELGDMTPNEWCEKFFTRAKIGKEKEDNGLLLMISPGSKQAFIMPGYGMEGVFTDIACKKIAEQTIRPAMQQGNLDEAVVNSTDMIISAIDDPAVADELRSEQSENLVGQLKTLDTKVIWKFVRYAAAAFFIIALIVFFFTARKARRETSNYGSLWPGGAM